MRTAPSWCQEPEQYNLQDRTFSTSLLHLAFSILVHYESLIIPLREVEKSEQEATWLKE